MFIDINECENHGSHINNASTFSGSDKGRCDQICINTNGSYYCDCNVGYLLASDSFKCEGKFVWNRLY